jgi:hypothetical protein
VDRLTNLLVIAGAVIAIFLAIVYVGLKLFYL